jgi:hypothetical protein
MFDVLSSVCAVHICLSPGRRESRLERQRGFYGTDTVHRGVVCHRIGLGSVLAPLEGRSTRALRGMSCHCQLIHSHRNERRQTTECGSWGVERLRVSEYGFTNVLSTHLARRRDDHDACGSFFAISFSFSIRGPCFCFWRMQMLGREHQHAPHRLHAPWRAWRLFGRRSEILYRYCSLYGFRLHSRFAKIE